MRRGESSKTIVREVKANELESLPEAIHEWSSGFIEIPATRNLISSSAFDSAGCFVAEEDSAPAGCVALTRLPRKGSIVIRYLSTRRAVSHSEIVELLLARALEHIETAKPEFLRATTPAVQPYVDAYKKFGFKPVRRDFRIIWDLKEAADFSKTDLKFSDVTDNSVEEVSHVFVEMLHPFWDWRTEEQGGEATVARSFREAFMKQERWISGCVGKKIVGLVGLIPNFYGEGGARFRGVYVTPEFRGRGYGGAMMSKGLEWARRLGQRSMTVYTFSFLDSLAPGALLYMRSGGRINSEYLQLRRAS